MTVECGAGLLMENKSLVFLFIDIWSIFIFVVFLSETQLTFLLVIGSHIHSKYEVKTGEAELE